MPALSDYSIRWQAAHACVDVVMPARDEVWRFTEGFMHQRVALLDDHVGAVGNTNIDNRSFRLNALGEFWTIRQRHRFEVQTMLSADLAQAFSLTKRSIEQPPKVRYRAPIAGLFEPPL